MKYSYRYGVVLQCEDIPALIFAFLEGDIDHKVGTNWRASGFEGSSENTVVYKIKLMNYPLEIKAIVHL